MTASLLAGRLSVRLVLAGVALAAACAAAPGGARADSLVYVKAGNVYISNSDGSDPRQVTGPPNGWAWPSQADDGSIFAAGGAVRVNADGSDSDGGSEIYHLDQNGRQIGPFVETYGSRSTPACPTDSPTSVRVSPNGTRVAFDQALCSNRDSFYQDLSNGHQTVISEDYHSNGWLDDGHVLITHVGPTFGNAAYASYDIANPNASHGPTDDPYLPGYLAVASRTGNRVAVYEDDPNIDGTIHAADIRIYETVGGDVTQPVERCTLALAAGNALSTTTASPTFTPDGSRLAWAEKDGIHTAATSDLSSCSAVTDKLLVAGAAYPFFGKADKSSTAGYIASDDEHKTCCPPPPPPPPGRFAIVSPTRRAKLARTGALTFAIRPAKAGTATARASVKVGGKKLRFKQRTLRLAARTTKKITLKLSRSAARRALSALRAHRKLTATITVSMAAGNGDTGRLSFAVRLRR